MAFEKMTNREQVLILLVAATFIGGAYGMLRFVPVNKELGAITKVIEENKVAIQTPKIPDEPDEDIEDLEEKLAEVNKLLESERNIFEAEIKKLTPVDEVQDVLLKISESGRTSNVKIIESVPYIVQRVIVEKKVENTANLSKNAQKRRAKAARKAMAAAGQANGGAQGVAPKEGELIYRLVNGFEDSRPMQKLSIEGGFKDIQSFIKALSRLQYQVTILKLDIDLKFQTPAQGIPQPLLAKMIIAI
jgi:hypothetical protein